MIPRIDPSELTAQGTYSTYIEVQGWLSGSSVMMLNKSYGMFWVQTQPCTLKQLKKVLPLTTQCVCIDLIVVNACDCVVCSCNDSVGPGRVAAG